jgi:cytochrome P450
MTPAFAAAAEASTRRLCTAAGPVDVEIEMRRATLQVVMDTLLASYDGAVPDLLAHTLFGDAVVRPTALDLMGAPAWIPAPGRAVYRSRVKALREQAREAVKRRRATDLETGDLLGAMLAARDPEERARPERPGAGRQHPDLHRRRPRDDGRDAHLDALPHRQRAGGAGAPA